MPVLLSNKTIFLRLPEGIIGRTIPIYAVFKRQADNMLLSKDKSQGQYEIKRYEPGKVVVNENTFTKSLIISAEVLLSDWRPQFLAELAVADFEVILSLRPEIILLGTGDSLQFPERTIFQTMMEHNIGFEPMNNSAACRTFNVLMSEGRNAVLALLMGENPEVRT